MSHLDEGTLHALLDGELEINEVKEIQAHLGSCAACGSRLREMKEFLAESDRLVGAVQFPGSMRPRPDFTAEEAPAAAAAQSPLRQRAAPRRADPETGPPVLLLPDNPDFDVRARPWVRGFRWAAILALAVGIGSLAGHLQRGGAPIAEFASKSPAPASQPAESAPVVSQEAAGQQGSGAAGQRGSGAAGQRGSGAVGPSADSATKPATPAKATRPNPAPAKTVPPSKLDKPQQEQLLAVREGKVEEPKDEANELAEADSLEAAPEDPSVDRSEAAAAMAELDRERRLERAKTATALLSGRRETASRSRAGRAAAAGEPPVALVPAPPLAPRTLEQRSQVYLRIGLDEAARQLGRPVHVIEGLSPAFMGLAQGRISPGADSTRPVVRVVYQDTQGRMIVLDQQRLRPGQTPAANDARWSYGDISLSLFGEVGPEVLKNLRPRVR